MYGTGKWKLSGRRLPGRAHAAGIDEVGRDLSAAGGRKWYAEPNPVQEAPGYGWHIRGEERADQDSLLYTAGNLILLFGVRKKSNKLPKKDIRKARNMKREFQQEGDR